MESHADGGAGSQVLFDVRPEVLLMRITQTQHSTKDGTRNYTPREGAVELRVVG